MVFVISVEVHVKVIVLLISIISSGATMNHQTRTSYSKRNVTEISNVKQPCSIFGLISDKDHKTCSEVIKDDRSFVIR